MKKAVLQEKYNVQGNELVELGTVQAAQALLGWSIISTVDGVRCSGTIVETEAYCQYGDEASHSRCGETERNRSMFLDAGHWYVYRSYGVHWCLNFVTADSGIGEAVLIRSIAPLEGLDTMIVRRKLTNQSARGALNGPGKVCQALGISKNLDGESAFHRAGCQLWIEPPPPHLNASESKVIRATPRIGITRSSDLPWRFLLEH